MSICVHVYICTYMIHGNMSCSINGSEQRRERQATQTTRQISTYFILHFTLHISCHLFLITLAIQPAKNRIKMCSSEAKSSVIDFKRGEELSHRLDIHMTWHNAYISYWISNIFHSSHFMYFRWYYIYFIFMYFRLQYCIYFIFHVFHVTSQILRITLSIPPA